MPVHDWLDISSRYVSLLSLEIDNVILIDKYDETFHLANY